MKSWTATALGPPTPHSLTLTSSQPIPTLPPHSTALLLKITHVSLNPADLVLLQTLPPWLPFRRAPVPGLDFAGEVVAVGDAVPSYHDEREGEEVRFKVGQRACGAVGLWEVFLGRGTLAEYAVVESRLVARAPRREGWTGREAVGVMGIAGQTALSMVKRVVAGRQEERMRGWRVLVNGASGGVGTLLVQACKALGAEVYGVCSGANQGMVKGLGANEVIDYREHNPLEEYLAQRCGEQPFDAIFDCAGSQALYSHSPRYLKSEGKFITIVGGWSQGVVPFVRNKLRPCLVGGTPRSYDLFLLSASGQIANEVAAWVEQGVIKQAVIDMKYPMEQLVEALQRLATGRARGKIVMELDATA